jgi:hypothetical protein
MVKARVPLKAAQERLGHSRPDISSQVLRACPRRVGGRGGGDAEWAAKARFGAAKTAQTADFMTGYPLIGS